MIYRPITKETGMPGHRRAFLSGEVDDQVSVRSAGDTSDEATPKYIRLRRNGPSYLLSCKALYGVRLVSCLAPHLEQTSPSANMLKGFLYVGVALDFPWFSGQALK